MSVSDMLWTAYFVVAALLITASVFLCGYEKRPDLIGPCVCLSLAWLPLVGLCVVSLPFIALYRFGERCGERNAGWVFWQYEPRPAASEDPAQ